MNGVFLKSLARRLPNNAASRLTNAGLGVLSVPKTISGIINVPGNVNDMFFFLELQTTLNIRYAGHEIAMERHSVFCVTQ